MFLLVCNIIGTKLYHFQIFSDKLLTMKRNENIVALYENILFLELENIYSYM